MKIKIPVGVAETGFKVPVHFVLWDCEKSKTPGLVVHKEILAIKGQEVSPRKKELGNGYYWAVSHHSGIQLIGALNSNRQAHEFAAAVNSLDWTVSEDIIKSDDRYKTLIKSVFNKLILGIQE